MTVLILGGADDEHAAHMLSHLRQRGTDAELLDSRGFPAELQVAYDPGSGAGSFRLPGGHRLAFGEIRAVYWRVYHGVRGPQLPDAEQALIAASDDAPAVGRKRGGPLPAGLVPEAADLSARARVPEAHGLVVAHREQPPTVRRKTNSPDWCRMPLQHGP